jgi:3-deoxy-manno-octulosonate cytidylyltransferase (CMP-KDO synthetase)
VSDCVDSAKALSHTSDAVVAPRYTVVVPARYASTRFPGKPLIDLGGKPMVVRVAERALQSSAERVVVATDDERIARACAVHGIDVAMTRNDHATGTDRLSEVVAQLGLADDALVVNVQGDEPLIPAPIIARTAAHLAAHPNVAMATLCHLIDDIADVVNPNVVKCVLNEAGEALYFSRAPIPYARDDWRPIPKSIPNGLAVYRHIGMYAYRASFLRAFPGLAVPMIEKFEALEQLRALAHGFGIAVLRVDEPLPPGIDTPEDYERLRGAFIV